MENNKIESGSSRRAKIGTYSLITLAIVLAVVILVNLAINVLPAKYSKYSISKIGLYDIGDTSKELFENVTDDICIYVVSESSTIDEVTYNYVEQVASLNSKITYKKVDPAIHPAFLSTYTDEELLSTDTNIVVVNNTNGRSKVIPYSEIYYRQYSDEMMYAYYYYYGSMPDNPQYFDIEAQLANAVDYVTTEKLPVIYYTSGHNEQAIDAAVTKLIETENIIINDLPNTALSSDGVPEDADMIIIYAPTYDFTAEETANLRTYMEKGGNLFVISSMNDLTFHNHSNLYSLTGEYGLSYSEKMVFEGNSANTMSQPWFIIPQMISQDYTENVQNYLLIGPAHAIETAEESPEGVTITELLSTSLKGYAKNEISSSMVPIKEDSDEEGTFTLGAKAVKGNSSVIWIASSFILDSEYASYCNNIQYALSIITETCGKESSISIAAKTLQIEALQVTDSEGKTWSTILIVAVPLLALVIGFVIWRKRLSR